MGCDIHGFVEIKDHDDNWRIANSYFKDYRTSTPTPGALRVEEVPIMRDYRLFARLANVRNEDHLRYLSAARGLPTDVSLD